VGSVERLPLLSRRSRLLGAVLAPLSLPYRAAVVARRHWWRGRGVRLAVPVVSVGNLTCGGTGKTPTVEMVVRDLAARGWRPAVLSRGYGAAAQGAPNDEYRVLAANLPEVPHFASPDRLSAARRALDAGADVLVLDDGFQHLRLHRDLDIVLLDALRPFDNGRVLPAGLLREPLSSLRDANIVAITRSELVAAERLAEIRSVLSERFPELAVVLLATQACSWNEIGGKPHSPDAMRGRPVLAFCGVGNPEAFRLQVEGLGVELRGFLAFRDHHPYSARDLARIAATAERLGATDVVMTQKDAVKLESTEMHGALEGRRWLWLAIRQSVRAGGEAYRAALERLGTPASAL
jgi:tetraacyldisaccharide 4'-kinase